VDSNRGATKVLYSHASAGEDNYSEGNGVNAFNTDGFGLNATNDLFNNASYNYVAWQWKANGGTATATGSESGNNPAYSTQANQTSGFSIITYTGTGANSSSVVPHGLGVTPEVVIVKRRNGTSNWTFESSKTYNARGMYLNITDGSNSSGTDVMNKDSTNLSFVEIDNNRRVNHDGETYVAYCFASKQGYSKFGSYTGNGNADGPFVYTGFRPAWLMIHRTDSAGENWQMFDNKRDGFNNGSSSNKMLKANASETEDTNSTGFLDLVSNGFKIRESAARHNASGGTYIYMAFAEHPFVSSKGVPVTAR
jgi:hypothetical protein